MLDVAFHSGPNWALSCGMLEALLLHGPRKGPPGDTRINLFRETVPINAQMRYLGLVLDGRAHFTQLALTLVGIAAALGRLLPNVGGSGSICRCLYSGIIRSMALYGAPLWVEALTAQLKALLRSSQRIIAVRAIRGYRAVSWTTAMLLTNDPIPELPAEMLSEVYRYGKASRGACIMHFRTKKNASIAQNRSLCRSLFLHFRKSRVISLSIYILQI